MYVLFQVQLQERNRIIGQLKSELSTAQAKVRQQFGAISTGLFIQVYIYRFISTGLIHISAIVSRSQGLLSSRGCFSLT